MNVIEDLYINNLSKSQVFVDHSFTHLYRALYGDAIGGQKLSTNMAAGNQKHLQFTFSIKARPFHSRTSIRAHKHIF